MRSHLRKFSLPGLTFQQSADPPDGFVACALLRNDHGELRKPRRLGDDDAVKRERVWSQSRV